MAGKECKNLFYFSKIIYFCGIVGDGHLQYMYVRCLNPRRWKTHMVLRVAGWLGRGVPHFLGDWDFSLLGRNPLPFPCAHMITVQQRLVLNCCRGQYTRGVTATGISTVDPSGKMRVKMDRSFFVFAYFFYFLMPPLSPLNTKKTPENLVLILLDGVR